MAANRGLHSRINLVETIASKKHGFDLTKSSPSQRKSRRKRRVEFWRLAAIASIGTGRTMQFIRGTLGRIAFFAFIIAGLSVVTTPSHAQSIVVQGNKRVDSDTIRSYFSGTDQGKVNQAVKDLY